MSNYFDSPLPIHPNVVKTLMKKRSPVQVKKHRNKLRKHKHRSAIMRK